MATKTTRYLHVRLKDSLFGKDDGVLVFLPAGSVGQVDQIRQEKNKYGDITEQAVLVDFAAAVINDETDGTRVVQWTAEVEPERLEFSHWRDV